MPGTGDKPTPSQPPSLGESEAQRGSDASPGHAGGKYWGWASNQDFLSPESVLVTLWGLNRPLPHPLPWSQDCPALCYY